MAREYPILFHVIGRPPDPLESQVFLMRADGSDWFRIAAGSTFHSSVWSPDGRAIAFRRRPATAENAYVESEVGLMAPDGTERISLFKDQAPPVIGVSDRPLDGPTWSPDGESIAFASRADTDSIAIFVIARSGAQRRRLLPDLEEPHFNPSWARHDMNQLVYVTEVDGVWDIWRLDPAEPTAPQNISLGRVIHPHALRWSPEGDRLAFVGIEALAVGGIEPLPAEMGGGDDEVFVLDLSTLELIQVTSNVYFDMAPAWSPDGRSLLIGSDREEEGVRHPLEIWRIALDGSEEPMQLTQSLGGSNEPDWYWPSSCGATP